MEACYTVNVSSKEAHPRSTEKVFLGRLCEEIASEYLIRHKKWKLVSRNVRFRFGEVDLVGEDPKTGTRWVVEVRGRKASSHKAVWWLSQTKIRRLKKLANLMAVKTRMSFRILFLQVEVLESKKIPGQIRATIKEFEIHGEEY